MTYPIRSAESGIAMLGSMLSGKSTFLCALKQAVLEHGEDWILFTSDAASQRLLDEMSNALISDGCFPPQTRTVDTIGWNLYGTIERTEQREHFRPVTTSKDRVEVTLRLTDAPGGMGRADHSGYTARNELIHQLAYSRGILYMFDPIMEFTRGDSFQHVDSLLGELMAVVAQEPGFHGKLPHYLAVCVTKLDDPRVFRTAAELGMLAPDDNSRWGFPQVHEASAQELFHTLSMMSKSGNGAAVPRLLERCFHPERISYHATSAVGFMVNKRTGRFDPRDTANAYQTVSGDILVRGPVHPINVAEPVLWIIRQLTAVELCSPDDR